MRMTKKELKENELNDYLLLIGEFFKKNWDKIRMGLLIAGVAILFITLFVLTTRKTNSAAMMEFASGMYVFQNAQANPQERYLQSKAMFKAIIEKYPSSSIKKEVEYYLANSQFFLGEYDDALNLFEKTARGLKGSQLGMYSLQGIGKCYESKGNFEEALKAYKRAIEEYPKNFYVGNIILDEGRCYTKMGRTSDAVQSYEKIIASDTDTVWSREAKLRLNLLKG